MRFRDSPLKLAAFTVIGTFACVLSGIDLMDGEIHLRRLGHLSATGTPLRFAVFVCAYLLACCFVAFGWFVVRDEWSIDYRLRPKQAFDDPTRRA